MLPVVDAFKKKYNLQQLIIVVDSGLMSSNNIEELISKNYEFILGARIKNETKKIKEKIFSLKLNNGESNIIEKADLSKMFAGAVSKVTLPQSLKGRGNCQLSALVADRKGF